MSKQSKQLKEDKKKLAVARIRAIPNEFQISVGGDDSISRDEVIENIHSETSIGEKMVQVQLDFLRDMARGKLYVEST